MEYKGSSLETRHALDELQRYLSDQLAPLMVSDSVSLLLDQPAELAAVQIQAWMSGQLRGIGANVPVSSYLFHALKKIHILGEFKLIPEARIDKYVQELSRLVAERYCPAEELTVFQENLALIGQIESSSSSTLEILHHPSGTAPVSASGRAVPPASGGGGSGAGGGPLTDEASRGLRRFSLMVERLARMPQAAPLAPSVHRPAAAGPHGGAAPLASPGLPSATALPEMETDLIPQILTTAALNSQTSADLEQYFARLRELGMEPRTDQIFRVLARSLPGWGVMVPATGGLGAAGVAGVVGVTGVTGVAGAAGMTAMTQAAGAVPVSGDTVLAVPRTEGPLEAMRRLLTLTDNPEEGSRRFSEMMSAAIEQFNEGNLAPAAAMFDLAERIMAERRLPEGVVKTILHRAHENLDTVRLGKLAEKPEKHALLRRVLSFFPELTARGLLDELEHEPKRDRRRLLLALLEVHGPAARSLAYDDLKASLDRRRTIDPFHQRNLVYLLRRIPRPPNEPWDDELNIVIRLCGSDHLPVLRKEAIATLGHMKHERAEQALIALLRDLEDVRVRPGASSIEPEEVVLLLDRTVYALSRFGTQSTWRAVIDHGLKSLPPLGDTTARLADLAGVDMSEDRESIARLVKALKEELPAKVLGFVVQRKNEKVAHLIRALSTTPAAPVRVILEEIVKRFPDEEFAKAAAKTLAAFGATARPPDAPATMLTGDLEAFGLPNLLQSLAESRVTGVLSISDPDGEVIGTLSLESGLFRGCHVGTLRGEEAIYQLFEKPVPGTFVLKSRRNGSHDGDPSEHPREVLPILLEAVRRYDEFRKARALVPDDLPLKPTGAKPTRTAEEKDVRFLRALWTKASAGATPAQCEAAISSDAYRIRALLAHWLRAGALEFQ